MKRIKLSLRQYLAILCTLLIVGSVIMVRNNNIVPITQTDFVLNTVATITIYDSNDTSLLENCFDMCRSYEAIFSATNPTSELYQLNEQFHSSSNVPITLSNELSYLLTEALTYAVQSQGSFDPTIGAITSLWDFTGNHDVPPTTLAIAQALPLVNYNTLTIEENTITNTVPQIRLDLGGIAKGYIADRIKEYLIEQGVSSAYINLGGNVLCIGDKPDNTPFHVGIQAPFAQSSNAIATLSIRDSSVVTCGIYERSFTYHNIFYHHILNPATGYPYENDILSVTIISPHSIDGDALSTVCYALGVADGTALIESLPNTYGIFVLTDGSLAYTKGAKSMVE